MPKKEEIKKGKKKWIGILAPKEFNNIEIGETYSSSPKDLIGRKVQSNLMILIGDSRKQNIEIGFRIKDLSGEKLITELISYQISPAHIKRITRRTGNKIEDSFVTESKDKVKFRIKPLLLTKSETKRSILANLRRESRKLITENAQKTEFINLIQSLIPYQLQKDIKNSLKKIYPLAIYEIRVLEKI